MRSRCWLLSGTTLRFLACPVVSSVLVYPARGFATATHERPAGALDRLIGSNRAAILNELEYPATSSELSAQLGLSLGTVGGHLTALRDAGLIVGTRVGRRVVYRPPGGDALRHKR